jgi:hypothetical protein
MFASPQKGERNSQKRRRALLRRRRRLYMWTTSISELREKTREKIEQRIRNKEWKQMENWDRAAHGLDLWGESKDGGEMKEGNIEGKKTEQRPRSRSPKGKEDERPRSRSPVGKGKAERA